MSGALRIFVCSLGALIGALLGCSYIGWKSDAAWIVFGIGIVASVVAFIVTGRKNKNAG